jgi:hypothetical protein
MYPNWVARVLIGLAPLWSPSADDRLPQPMIQQHQPPAQTIRPSRSWRDLARRYIDARATVSGQHTIANGSLPQHSPSADLRLTGQPLHGATDMGYEFGFNLRPLAKKDRLRLTQASVTANGNNTQLHFGNVSKTVYDGSRFAQSPPTMQAFQIQKTIPWGRLGYYSNNLSPPNGLAKKLGGFSYEPPELHDSRLKFYHFFVKDRKSEAISNHPTQQEQGAIFGLLGERRLSTAMSLSGECAVSRRDRDVTDGENATGDLGGMLDVQGDMMKTKLNLSFNHLGPDFGHPLSPAMSSDRRSLNLSVNRQWSWFDSQFVLTQSQTNLRKRDGKPISTQRQWSIKTSCDRCAGQMKAAIARNTSATGASTKKSDSTVDLQFNRTNNINPLRFISDIRQSFFPEAAPGNPQNRTTLGLTLPWHILSLRSDAKFDFQREQQRLGPAQEKTRAQLAAQGAWPKEIRWLNAQPIFDAKLNHYTETNSLGVVTEKTETEAAMQARSSKPIPWLNAQFDINTRFGFIEESHSSGLSTRRKSAQFVAQGGWPNGIPGLHAHINFDVKVGRTVTADQSGSATVNEAISGSIKSGLPAKILSFDASLMMTTQKNSLGTVHTKNREYAYELKLKPPLKLFERGHLSLQTRSQHTLDILHPERHRHDTRITFGLSYRFDF